MTVEITLNFKPYTNQEMIEMHIEEHFREQGYNPGQIDWATALAYASGYYEEITLDVIRALVALVKRGFLLEVTNRA